MHSSKAFSLLKAGDSDFCTKGLSQSNYKKLDLDDFNHGTYKNTIHIWFRDLEFNIRKDIIKIHKNNRFSNFSVLPFIWNPCFNNDLPEDSPHFGFPNSPTEFQEFKDAGLYKNTPVEYLDIVQTRIRTRSMAKQKSEKDDTPDFEILDTPELIFSDAEYKVTSTEPGDTRSPKELASVFCKFFTGFEPERMPFKKAEKRTWTGLFEIDVLAELRDSVKIAVITLLAVIPSLYESSFKQNRVRSWAAFKDLISKAVKVKEPKHDPLILMSAMKILSSPACRCFRVESRMITYRDLCLEHFHGNKFSGEEIEIGESEADPFTATNKKPEYDSMHNLIALELVLSAEPTEKVLKWKEDIALRKRMKIQEVDMFVLLSEKEFLYDKINSENNAKNHLDRGMVIFAHEKCANDVVKGVLQYQKSRFAAKSENINPEPQKSLKSVEELVNCLEEIEGTPELEEIFVCQEDLFFYKRVDRPRENNFRKYKFQKDRFRSNGTRGRGDFKRVSDRGRPRNRADYNSRPQNRINFSRNKKIFNKNRRFSNNFKGKLNDFRKRSREFLNPEGKKRLKISRDSFVPFGQFEKLRLFSEEILEASESSQSALEDLLALEGNISEEEKIHILSDKEEESTETFSEEFSDTSTRINFLSDVETLNQVTFFNNWFEEDSNKEREILRKGLILELKNKSSTFPVKIILDTGASSSLIPLSVVEFLKDRAEKVSCLVPPARVAGGGSLTVENFKVSLPLDSNKIKIWIKNALVNKGGNQNLILLGFPDLVDNGFILSTRKAKKAGERGKITKLELQGADLVDVSEREILNILEDSGSLFRNESGELEVRAQNDLPKNSHVTFSINGHKLRKRTDQSDCDFVVNEKIKTMVATWNYPLGMKAWQNHIDKLGSAMSRKNTRADVKIDPLNEVLPNLENGEEIRLKLNKILDKRRDVFRGDVGLVKDPKFKVFADIKRQLLGKSVANYYANMAPQILEAVIKKFDDEIAAGILKELPHGETAEHILPIFPVNKKADDPNGSSGTDKVATNFTKIRLIADCSRAVNLATTYKPTQADSIRNNIQKVAKFTKQGFICLLDISQMFFSFPLDKSLWKYFCVEHPTAGIYCYTRLPMGWLNSPSISRLSLMKMLQKFDKNMCRYLDDVTLFHDDVEKFLSLVDGVLKTCWYYDLRLKGSKMTVFGKTIKLLGKTISNGIIWANEHVVKDLRAKMWSTIVTKKQMKGFLGSTNYIAEHLPYKTDLVDNLVKASTGVLADKFVWNEPLKEDFKRVQDACAKLLELHPIDPNKKLYLVVDSSHVATGAFMYQLNEKGEKNFVKIFSRKRNQAESKFALSSCLTELMGITVALMSSQYEIEQCREPVVVFTDNKPVYLLYKKLQNAQIPSNDKRVNNCFASLMGFDYQIEHIANTTPPIHFADYISREEELSKVCPGCRVCETITGDTDVFATDKKGSEPEVINFVNDLESSYKFIDPVVPKFNYFDYRDLIKTKQVIDPLKDCFEPIPEEDERRQKVELRYLLRNKNKDFEPDLKIQDLLNDKAKICRWQDEDNVLREVKKLYDNGGMASGKGKNSKIRHWLETQKAFSDGPLLKVKHYDGVRELNLVIIPEKFGPQIAQCIHNTFGHSSYHRFKTECKRYFHIKNIDSHLRSVVSRCTGCVALKNKPKILKEIRNFDEEIPEKIGQHILVDEITRMRLTRSGRTRAETLDNSSMWKFIFASDSLSRYSILLPYRGILTSDVFKSYLIKIRYFLGQGMETPSDMIISMDGCSIHQALANDPSLKQIGVQIKIRPRSSTSKNRLALLDGRIAKISKILNQEMSVETATKEAVAMITTHRYNNLPNKELGIRPSELFLGRDSITGEPIKVSVKELVERRKKLNRASRDSLARKLKSNRHVEPLNLVPWNPEEIYDGENPVPIKLGDQVFLDFEYDKNSPAPIFIVTANKEFPLGVDFELKMVNTRKKGVRSYKDYAWRFDCITEVVPAKPNEKEQAEALQKFGWAPSCSGEALKSVESCDFHENTTVTVSESDFESFESSDLDPEPIALTE